MHSSLAENNAPYDSIIDQIATYVIEKREMSPLAMQTAAYCLMDSIGCGLLALQFPECTKMLGPVVPGATTQNGARVFGTPFELDPITAAFNMGTLIRWLDYNDTWLAAEWGHPSDNFGAILAVTDYLDRNRPNTWTGARRWTIRDVLLAAIQAYEIQGVLALTNSFNRVGLDHVLLVRIASTAVSTAMLGGSHRQVCQALSQAWIDGGPFERIAMPRTQVLEKAGPPATPPVARFNSPCGPFEAKWDTLGPIRATLGFPRCSLRWKTDHAFAISR